LVLGGENILTILMRSGFQRQRGPDHCKNRELDPFVRSFGAVSYRKGRYRRFPGTPKVKRGELNVVIPNRWATSSELHDEWHDRSSCDDGAD
jgi:hypothetical protein